MSETETLEYKRSTSELKEAIISIAAMLNKHGGGELYFGIRNDGTPIGQDISEKTLRDVSQAISNRIEPKVFPIVEAVRFGSRECVRVKFLGSESPYYAYGRVYIRVGDEDQHLSPMEIERLILEGSDKRIFWDSRTTDMGPEAVNEEELVEFVQRANTAGRLEFGHSTIPSTLDKLDLNVPQGDVAITVPH